MLNIYKASAGSGKTFTLTKQYISLLLGHRDPETGRWKLYPRPCHAHRHILAITFTNKATDEMTERIISQLAILGGRHPNEKKSAYTTDLCKLFGIDPADPSPIVKLASETLDDILFDFAYFHVSTIDAFFQTVLRTFAREVEIPDDYEVELDTTSAIAIGVHEMFNSLNYTDPVDPLLRQRNSLVHGWLLNFINSCLDEGRDINLFSRRGAAQRALIGEISRLLDDTFRKHADVITPYVTDLRRISAFVNRLHQLKESHLDAMQRAAESLLAHPDARALNMHLVNALKKMALRVYDGSGTTVPTFIADPLSKISKSKFPKNIIPQSLADAAGDAARAIAPAMGFMALEPVLREASMRMGLLGSVLQYLDEISRDSGSILLSDTSSILSSIINDDETPFVYERLGYYLNHFLIDEFQDTSQMQWDNLRPMVMESLSRQNYDLIIGDEKQCIYRFRDSDPDLLAKEVGNQVTRTYGQSMLRYDGTSVEKNTNWRSTPEVVRLNNSLFRSLAALLDAESIYSNVVQSMPKDKKQPPGHVMLRFFDRKQLRDTMKESDGGGDDAALAPAIVDGVVAEVSRLLSSGYRMRDITILVRRHSEGAQVIERLLALDRDPAWPHGKVEITSSDTMLVSGSPAVKAIVEALRLPLLPKGASEATVRLSWLNHWYQYYISATPDGEEPSQNDALRAAIARTDALTAEGVRPDEVTALSLDSLVESVIPQCLSPEMIARETVFITAFQDLVLDYAERSGNDVASFLAWWDRSGRFQKLSTLPNADAIRIMTIHQSKGLDAECVIIPDADWEMVGWHKAQKPSLSWYPFPADALEDVHPDLIPPFVPVKNLKNLCDIPAFAPSMREFRHTQAIDSLNIAYVAFTRAVRELVAFVPSSLQPIDPAKAPDLLGDYIYNAVAFPTVGDSTGAEAPFLTDLRSAFTPDSLTLEIGTPTTADAKGDKSEESTAATLHLPAYVAGTNHSRSALTQTDIEQFDFDNPRHFGTFVHNILSRTKQTARLPLEVRRAAYRARISPEQQQMVLDMLTRALNHGDTRRWFDGAAQILTECTLALPGGRALRPDRVVITPGGELHIVDYKTGDPSPSHAAQVRLYAKTLRQAGFTQAARAFVWYLHTPRIEEIPLS